MELALAGMSVELLTVQARHLPVEAVPAIHVGLAAEARMVAAVLAAHAGRDAVDEGAGG